MRVAHLHARHQRDVGEPRLAAERRRLDERRDAGAARRADGLAERPPGGVERLGKLGTVERDGAVRLHEQQDDVGSLHAREIGVHRRAGRDGAAAAQGIDGEPRCRQ